MAKKNDKNKNKKSKPIQETLHEEAALRLKAFIEDLRHDPMFRHRLFYPVLYREIIRGNQHVHKNDVKSNVAEVIYEYYLLKMEKFSSDNAAKIFQAILISNGPMLPETDRFIISDAGNGNSILNPRNRDAVIRRTRVFIDVLKNENLFNFIFTTTVGTNLEQMRRRFRDLVNNTNQRPANINVATTPISNEMQQNLNVLQNLFENINEREIRQVVDFLIYMGDPRHIVTDFSYKPMPQNMLEDYIDYGLSEEQSRQLEFRVQLEQALDTNVLQKDINAQMDIFIPMLVKEYTAICLDDASIICGGKTKLPRELERALKNKLQRSLKLIADYTRNYITKELLQTDPEHPSDRIYISKVLQQFYQGLENNNTSVGELARNILNINDFVVTDRDDLFRLIREIFINDIHYIEEICSEKNNCDEYKYRFAAAWDVAHQTESQKRTEMVKKDLNKLLKDATKCFDSINKNDVAKIEKQIQKVSSTKTYLSDYFIAKTEARRELEIFIQNELDTIDDSTIAERIAKSIVDNISKQFKLIYGNIVKKALRSEHEAILKLASITGFIEALSANVESVMNRIKIAQDIDELYFALKEAFVLSSVIKRIENIVRDIDITIIAHIDNTLYRLIENFIRRVNNCVLMNKSLFDYISISDNPDDLIQRVVLAKNNSFKFRAAVVDPLADHLMDIYFHYFLRPVLINFFGYAFDNFVYSSRRNDIEADIISKDVLHFSSLLRPENVGLLTFDGAVLQDLAKFTYILTSDTYSGITYNNVDSVINFLNDNYGIKFFNLIIYGKSDAYIYLNNFGIPYLYRGAKTKIPIRELRKNYEFLMDPSRGLYKNIKLPKKKK